MKFGEWKKTSRIRFRRTDGYVVVRVSKTWFAKDPDGTWIKYNGDNASYYGRKKQWRISQTAIDWVDQEFAVEEAPKENPLTFGGGITSLASKGDGKPAVRTTRTSGAAQSTTYVLDLSKKASIRIDVNGSKVVVRVDVGS